MFGTASYYNSNPAPTFPRSQSQLASSSVSVYNQQPATSSNSLIQGVVPGSSYAGQMQMSAAGREMQLQQQAQSQMQSISGMVKADPSNNVNAAYPQPQQVQQYRQSDVSNQVASSTQQASSSQGSGQQSSSSDGDPAIFIPLKTARDAVENMMTNDESLFGNGLDDHLGAGSMGSGGLARPSLSNLYTSSPGSSVESNNPCSPVVQVSKTDLPNGVFGMLRGKGNQIAQGLLTDVGRAWFAVNGILILWDYTKEGDSGLVKVDHDAGNSVTCVGLVKADPNVFQGLTHLLVVAGNARTALLGLSYDSSSRSISLVDMMPNQPFLSAPTPPSANFTQIVCTPVGSRVFLLGMGCLYEFVYEAKTDGSRGWLGMVVGYGGGVKEPTFKNWTTSLEGWGNFIPLMVSKRETLVQLAIDHERDIIYGLTSDNKLQRWSIIRKTASTGGNALEPKAEGFVSPVDLARRQTEGSKFFDQGTKIVRIDVITKMESEACLVLTTSSNARIYMKDGAQSRGMGYSYAAGGFHVAHIRLPIESVPVAQGSGPLSITSRPLATSRYMHGVYAAVHQRAEEPSQMIWYAADPFEWVDLAAKRQQGQMITQDIPGRGTGFPESFAGIDFTSNVVDIAEEPEFWLGGDRALRRVVKGSSGPELSVRETHEMVTEVTIPSRRRFIVMTTGGVIVFEKIRPKDTLEHLFANGLGRTEFMLGIQRQLSSSVSPLLAIDIAIAAENGTGGQNGMRVRDYVPNNAAQGALDHLVNWANEQQKQKTLYHQSANAAQWKLDAVYLHLSRSLRSFWNSNVLATNPSTQLASSSLSIGQLQTLRDRLENMRALLDHRKNIFSSIDPTFVPNSKAADSSADSFHPARVLLDQTIQALAFMILLSEFRFESVLARCDSSLQRDLGMMSYFQLIVDPRGRDLAKRLVTNVVNQQISQDMSIEHISDKLQERCPAFCSRADVDLYKAMESLRKAKEVRQGIERQAHLESALDNFMKASPGLSEDKLNEIISDFCSLDYPAGCIQLPIEKAERVDPEHLAFTFYLDGRREDDGRKGNYEQRLKYYLLALSAVEKFDNDAAQQGPASEASRSRDLAYDYALNTGDDLFLMTLYQWMVQKGKSDQLLELENDAKVEAYLRYRGLTSGEPGLLWRFYARRNRHYRAAQALRELAEARIDLPMSQRVECLALASMHAKSSTMQDSERAPVDFVTELEETNDVANIQLEIWEVIANDPDVTEEAATKAEQLQGRLVQISELFTDFAEPLRLYESQLTILHASDHRDAQLVADVWNALLLKADHEAEDLSPSQRYRPFQNLVVRLGKRFYPSHAAFPTGIIVQSYYERGFEMKESPSGWVTGALMEAGISYREIWDTLGYLAQDQPPFDDQEGKRYLDHEIAVLLPSWIDAVNAGQDQPFFPGVTDYLSMRSKSRDTDQDVRAAFERGIRQIMDLLRTTRTH